MGFRDLLSVINREKKLYLQMHRPPDPDCLASTVILSDMLKSVGISSTIVYTGVIRKPETIELIDSLNIKLTRLDIEANKGLVKDGDQIIVIDCQKENSNVTHLDGDYIACIDHHPEIVDKSYSYEDIRPEFGACSSMIYEYAIDYGYELNPIQAALLIYGIRIDTDDLSRKKYIKDIDIFCDLYKIANLEILYNIGRNSIRPEDISTTIMAYENLTIKRNIAFSYAGDDKAKESLAELADRLISLADVDFVVVYSKCFNGYTFSVRSQFSTMHAGRIVRYAFSKVNGDGGGHVSMAGGLIPKVAFMDLIGDKKIMERIIEMFEDAFDNVKPESTISSV